MKGIMFTFTIAIISYILAKFPILHTIGALAIAIIFAMIYRQVIGYPEHSSRYYVCIETFIKICDYLIWVKIKYGRYSR